MSSAAEGAAHPRVSPFNAANALTVLRLVLVPAFVVVLFSGPTETELPDADSGWFSGSDDYAGWRLVAAMLFWLAAVTDKFDGWVARKYDLETRFGEVADPIADKALVGSGLIALSILGDLAWWITVVIIAREAAVTLLRFWVRKRGLIASSRGGKAKTVAQTVAVWMLLMPFPDWMDPISMVVMYVAVVLTVATGVDYFVRAAKMRGQGDG